MTPKHGLEAFVVGDRAKGCVWLERLDGSRTAALWPSGYRARFDPLRIYNERDELVWQERSLKTLSGGPSPVHVDRIAPACRTGDLAWWIPVVAP